MKANKIWGALLATTFGLAAMSAVTDAEAQKKKKATEAPALTGPAQAVKPIQIPPATAPLKWGLTIKETWKAIDTMLDTEYKPLYQKVSPGVKMKQLDAALREEKNAFRRSRIDFGNLPVALDSTPLKGEYTYKNNESILTLSRNGEMRYFFFIQDRLWKIIDEVQLSEKSPWGKTFQDAAVKLTAQYGAVGRVIQPNPDKQIYVTTVDWKDATTHVRLVERHETAVAIVYEDNATLANIDTLRANKPVVEDDIDPAVRAAARGSEPPPGPPQAAEKDKKK
ncbi:MAG: hypothetical protein IPM54_36350 [Polyangiaceae bacterium]|nr:hypothetical protein [Polyangiaceae bacterium]